MYNKIIDKWKYSIVLDTNIYDFLLKSLKKENANEQCRRAVALLVFCQLSQIEVDPALAVQEKLNTHNLEETIKDLEMFHNLNNAESNMIANYALGKSKRLNIQYTTNFNYKETKEKLLLYEKPDEWNSIYLMILKIASIYSDNSIQFQNRITIFLEWSISEFRLVLPSVIYALILFGKKPASKMMKYKRDDTSEQKSKCLVNMTWDLFHIKDFFLKWSKKREGEEYIFASDDKVFGKILYLAIQVQLNGNLETLRPYLEDFDFKNSTKLLMVNNPSINRVYGTSEWTSKYRENKILEYEHKLGLYPTNNPKFSED